MEFDPVRGRKQAGRRPAMIVSPDLFNGPSRLHIAEEAIRVLQAVRAFVAHAKM